MTRIEGARVLAVLALLLQPCDATAQEDHFVDLGAHSLHAVVSGSGTPVVVLESGLGLGLETWDPVRERIAEFTRVIAYSRAGYGRSEASEAARTPARISDELLELLDGLGVTEPVVLVGHSLGGLYSRVFAARYPTRTAGLVLVDGTHERQHHEWSGLSPTFWEDTRGALDEYAEIQGGATAAEIEEEWTVHERGTLPEAHPLPDVPTVVLTAQRTDSTWVINSRSGREIWRRMHQEYLQNSHQGWQVLVPESGHMIHEEVPSLVVETIRTVVHRIRGGT